MHHCRICLLVELKGRVNAIRVYSNDNFIRDDENRLRDLIIVASPDVKTYRYGVSAIFAVGIVGMAGAMIL